MSEDIDSVVLRGARHHGAGELAAARASYQEALRLDQHHPEANHNLAVLLMQTGADIQEAIGYFQRAFEANPSHQEHWQSLLRALLRAGALGQAEQVYRAGLAAGLSGPSPAQLSAVPGKLDRNDPNAALQAMQRAAQAGNWSQALLLAQSATQLWPRLAVFWRSCAHLNIELKQWRAAYQAARQWQRLEAGNREASMVLAYAALHAGRSEEALDLLLPLAPKDLAIERLLAQCYEKLGQFDAGIACGWRAHQLAPGDLEIYQLLGSMLHHKQDQRGLEQLTRTMCQLKPNWPNVWADRGMVQLKQGVLSEATTCFERALKLAPQDHSTRSQWLFCLNYSSEGDARQRRVEAERYGAHVRSSVTAFRHAPRKAKSRLRIGFISGDMRAHPVGFFLRALLKHGGPAAQWHLYSTHSREDALSAELKSYAEAWVELEGLSPQAMAQRIHSDGIDVLVDLAGHTAHNGLPAMAYKPAPLQLAWLGYFATTGLKEIDAVLADPISVPAAHAEDFVERVVHLPRTRLCYSAPDGAPPVAPAPWRARGHLTLGSFQALAKLNDEVLSLWGKVLAENPTAHMRVQALEFDDTGHREHFAERARSHQWPMSRVFLAKPNQHGKYFEDYAEVDVLLDPFPFPGGTTTCEALYMGVPTITLRGASMIERQGASLLTAAGLTAFIAENPGHYRALVQQHLAAPEKLAALRDGMRAELLLSPLMDSEAFARDWLEKVFELWHERS